MAEVSVPNARTSTSPPPNCAICLGTCTNKCFSDSCMHQFCFTCLLEWSKVKAECPLCKQPFTSIIHNVKSNNEYDEHIVEPIGAPSQEMLDENDFLYLPTAQPSRHFQFRTTFTVDPRGELAIQQMLLTHSRLTNSVYMPNYNYRHRHRRDVSSTNFRRMVYARSMWVTAPPDITGRYRDISPHFYRENPAAINRLVPWLNRELNALLEENTQQVMLLVDIILSHLNRHHIRGFFFKNLLREYLGTRTEHFIHEFYSYMKSPYDMVGYDRHAYYTSRNAFVHTIPSEDSSSSTDSDVTVVATTSSNNTAPTSIPNPFHRPTIEVIEINSDSSRDSDVIIQEPPPPVVVDLINTTDDDDEDEIRSVTLSNETETKRESTSSASESDVKHKYNSLNKRTMKKNKEKYEKSRKRHKDKIKSSKYIYSSSSSSSSNTSDSSSDSNNYKYYKRRKKQKVKKSSRTKYVPSSSTNSTDDEPLIEKVKKMKSKKKDKNKRHYKHKEKQSSSADDETITTRTKPNYYYPNIKTDVPSSSEISNSFQDEQNNDSDKPLDYSMSGFAGPSYRSTDSPKIKKERCNLWYSRPRVYDSDSSAEV